MSDAVVSWAERPDEAIAAALRGAVELHRQQLERLAMAVARVERIDREVADLAAQRLAVLAEYEQLYGELTSGRAAGDAISALGLSVAAGVGGGVSKAGRASRRRAPRKAVRAARDSAAAGGGSASGEAGSFGAQCVSSVEEGSASAAVGA